MSLPTKLLIVTAFSLLALLIAFLSAGRTAQMSETFALRQATKLILTRSFRENMTEYL